LLQSFLKQRVCNWLVFFPVVMVFLQVICVMIAFVQLSDLQRIIFKINPRETKQLMA